MNSAKKLIILIALSSVLFISIMPPSIADTTEIVTDDEDDVMAMSLSGDTGEQNYISTKPNLDITKITYFRSDQSSEVTITLEVKGEIENVNDMDLYNYSDNTGSVTTYMIYLETSNNSYQISYLDGELLFENTGIEGNFTIDDNKLIITFDLVDASETFVSLYGYSMSIDLSDLLNPFKIDMAPNEALFIPVIDAPDTAEVGEAINFQGEVNDLLGFGFSLADDPYLWDFDDGTTSTKLNPTHTYSYKGTYTVTLTVESSTGETSSATKEITVGAASTNNGNTNNGGNTNDGSDEDSGSGFMLFVGVVVVIIIIGVIALVVVIRR